MDEQDRVAAHDHESDPAYRALDLAAEVGEIAADVTKSSDDGHAPGGLHVARDELGDALLALCEPLNVDAGDALDETIDKYETRVDETGDAGSGE